MAESTPSLRPAAMSVANAALEIKGLEVAYDGIPVVTGLDLRLDRGVLAVVGRNGMGKTTLCNAVMGLVPAAKGTISADGREITNLASHLIARHRIGYVPQGRRVWPSLTVDEHLRLAFLGDKDSSWTPDRVYAVFPRLAERRGHGGSQLSGGEQQMLAIGRALLGNPRLLVMDEPSEGLAPVIVEQVVRILKDFSREGQMSVLLIEQNLGVALEASERIAVMLHGRLVRDMASTALAGDRDLQQRLLGVGRHDQDEDDGQAEALPEPPSEVHYIRIERSHGDVVAPPMYTFSADAPPPVYSAREPPTRWAADSDGLEQGDASAASPSEVTPAEQVHLLPVSVASLTGRSAYVAGTFDTKGPELTFIANTLRRLGVRTITVDLATSGRPSPADISPREVARHHPQGEQAVFTGDRGQSVIAMAGAFERFICTRTDVGGIISAGGSGGTALATPAMRALPVGIPKFMVSTVASGNVAPYVGPSDISMMYSVTDVQGINSITEQVLSNAANALAGMIGYKRREGLTQVEKPAIGLTMFGLTTPCVQAVQRALQSRYDCLTFHATGTGGQSMEKLVDSGLLAGVLDVTTTEVADLLMGGVFSAGEDRFGAIMRRRVPYVGSCGALDMVNFHAKETVPARYAGRNLYIHNANVTLMRTTPAENEAMGRWIGDRLNRMQGPVRFLLPLGGMSGIDAPGRPFHDAVADKAFFDTITRVFMPASNRKLLRFPHHINDPQFAAALVENFNEIMK
jgi:uncharacterized protein (UPF0261 family)/ABC-type branched-subunit amino acid transport system ATPase component